MTPRIGCIVEGHGEREAVPILIRRIANEVLASGVAEIPHVQRVPKNRLVKEGELERSVELAARKLRGPGGLFIILDSDDDCPGELGPALLARVRSARGDLPAVLVLAKREFEAWFIAAAASSTEGVEPLALPRPPPDPEAVRDAKGWVSRHILNGAPYSETIEQPALTATFDFAATRYRSDSFDKCYRDVSRLLATLTSELPGGAGDARRV